jgi:hypothetical protein
MVFTEQVKNNVINKIEKILADDELGISSDVGDELNEILNFVYEMNDEKKIKEFTKNKIEKLFDNDELQLTSEQADAIDKILVYLYKTKTNIKEGTRLTLKDYARNVLNEEDENEKQEPENNEETEKQKDDTPKEKECDTILTVECCGTNLKKIIDAIKKTDGNFKVEIDTGDEEKELQIEWDSEKDMIGTVNAEKKDK